MDTINILLRITEAYLKLRGAKEDHKYIDELLALRKEYYDEYTKPFGERSDAILDHCRNRLRVLTNTISSTIGNAGTTNK